MIVSLIAGVITGFIVSIPPLGPISFALISNGFNDKIKEGLAIALGAAFMDFVYCLIAFGGISLLITLLPDSFGKYFSENSSLMYILLTYAGCLIVIVYGIKIMKSKISYSELESKQSEKIVTAEVKAKAVEEKAKEFAVQHHVPQMNKVDKSNLGGLFVMGVLLCMSSITLPASWIAFVGYLKGYKIIDSSFSSGLLFSSGAFLGTWTWFYTLLKLITGNKHRINPATVSKLNVTAGIILLLLGVFLFFQATSSIFNS
ncbi:MAG: LysE family translocator [Ignavibacteria bacterium]